MPTDVSVEMAAQVADSPTQRTLPVGIGLTLGALASVALWAGIGMSLHALFA